MGARLIQGLQFTPLRRIETAGGDVMHALKASAPGFSGFGEAYFSRIHDGAIKGWRRHKRVTLNLIVPISNVQFVAFDDRAESGTKGRFETVFCGIDNYGRLTVPPNLWLAFKGLGPGTALVLDIVDEEHDPSESDTLALDQLSYRWTN